MVSLDGSGSLHGMGIIAVSTPKDDGPLTAKSRVINRQPRVKVDELVKDKGVPIIQYIGPHVHPLASVLYKPIIEIHTPYTLPSELYSNLLWHSRWTSAILPSIRSGFMQNAFSSYHASYCKSEVLLLPIIDLSPSGDNYVFCLVLHLRSG